MPTAEKIALVRDRMNAYGDPDEVARLAAAAQPAGALPSFTPPVVRIEEGSPDAVSF